MRLWAFARGAELRFTQPHSPPHNTSGRLTYIEFICCQYPVYGQWIGRSPGRHNAKPTLCDVIDVRRSNNLWRHGASVIRSWLGRSVPARPGLLLSQLSVPPLLVRDANSRLAMIGKQVQPLNSA